MGPAGHLYRSPNLSALPQNLTSAIRRTARSFPCTFLCLRQGVSELRLGSTLSCPAYQVAAAPPEPASSREHLSPTSAKQRLTPPLPIRKPPDAPLELPLGFRTHVPSPHGCISIDGTASEHPEAPTVPRKGHPPENNASSGGCRDSCLVLKINSLYLNLSLTS